MFLQMDTKIDQLPFKCQQTDLTVLVPGSQKSIILWSYLLLPKYTTYLHIHTQLHKNTLPSCPTYSPLFTLPFVTTLHNTEEMWSGYTLRLDLSIAPWGCRVEKMWKDVKLKKHIWIKWEMTHGRATIVCFLACRGLQSNLLHLLWKLTVAGEWYVRGDVWHLHCGPKPAGKRPGKCSIHSLCALDDPRNLILTLHTCTCVYLVSLSSILFPHLLGPSSRLSEKCVLRLVMGI